MQDETTGSAQDAAICQRRRKGRHSEVCEINGHVVATLAAHRQFAPVNDRVVRLALEIESCRREAGVGNLAELVAAVG